MQRAGRQGGGVAHCRQHGRRGDGSKARRACCARQLIRHVHTPVPAAHHRGQQAHMHRCHVRRACHWQVLHWQLPGWQLPRRRALHHRLQRLGWLPQPRRHARRRHEHADRARPLQLLLARGRRLSRQTSSQDSGPAVRRLRGRQAAQVVLPAHRRIGGTHDGGPPLGTLAAGRHGPSVLLVPKLVRVVGVRQGREGLQQGGKHGRQGRHTTRRRGYRRRRRLYWRRWRQRLQPGGGGGNGVGIHRLRRQCRLHSGARRAAHRAPRRPRRQRRRRIRLPRCRRWQPGGVRGAPLCQDGSQRGGGARLLHVQPRRKRHRCQHGLRRMQVAVIARGVLHGVQCQLRVGEREGDAPRRVAARQRRQPGQPLIVISGRQVVRDAVARPVDDRQRAGEALVQGGHDAGEDAADALRDQRRLHLRRQRCQQRLGGHAGEWAVVRHADVRCARGKLGEHGAEGAQHARQGGAGHGRRLTGR